MEAARAPGAARFSCPPNFTAMAPDPSPPRFSLETLTGPETELWLIQAPADFAPHCLNGRSIPLSGSRIVRGKLEGKRHRYQVLSSGPQAGEATLLAPSAEAGGGLACVPAAQGSLRIIEGPQESPGTPLQAIPASLPPQIPTGLRPRFCAFGGSPPVTGPASALALSSPTSGKKKKKKRTPEASATQEAVNGHQAMEADTALGGLEMDVGKKKKKKKQVGEGVVMEPVAMELAPQIPEQLGQTLSPPTSNKKSRGTETVKPYLRMQEPEEKPGDLRPVVKTEAPVGTILSPTKKRKRQREAEEMEPGDGITAGCQPQINVGLQEEAIALSPRKKKKKEKRGRSGIEAGEPETGLQGAITEPELSSECGLQAEAALVSPKKKKKRESVTVALGEKVIEAGLPTDLGPQEALASNKKKKKKEKATEPVAEVTDQRGFEEPEATAGQGSSKKKKKRQRESGEPGAANASA